MTEKQTTFIGSFWRPIAGKRNRPHVAKEGDALLLVREPGNPYDENAIRIENNECDLVGYVPRQEATWLAPLLDSERIRLEGVAQLPGYQRHPRDYIEIFVALLDESILEVRAPQNSLEASHQMVVQTFLQLDQYDNPALILEMRDRLRNSVVQTLPETKLLLSLFRSKSEAVLKKSVRNANVSLEKAFGGLLLGEPLRNNGFGIIPIYNKNKSRQKIILLKQALQDQVIRVKEASNSGDVQTVVVQSLCPEPILIPEGEILVGAKQNRVVNVSILLGGHSKLRIPVSCVEQGRWRFDGDVHFQKSSKATPTLRGKNIKFVKESRESNRGYEGNQGAVWSEVHYQLAETNTASSTDSLTDLYKNIKEEIHKHSAKFTCPKDAAGFIFLSNNLPIGLDIYADAVMLEQSWDSLIDSYLSDAIYYRRDESLNHTIDAEELLEQLKTSLEASPETIGIGQRFDMEKSLLKGSCLIDNSDLCHASCFMVN